MRQPDVPSTHVGLVSSILSSPAGTYYTTVIFDDVAPSVAPFTLNIAPVPVGTLLKSADHFGGPATAIVPL